MGFLWLLWRSRCILGHQGTIFKMAEDREVLREIWDGRIPVCFNLSSEEIVTVEQPEPYYVSKSIYINFLRPFFRGNLTSICVQNPSVNKMVPKQTWVFDVFFVEIFFFFIETKTN